MEQYIIYFIFLLWAGLNGYFQFKNNNHNKKELIIYGTIMGMNIILIGANIFEIELPSPLEFITLVYKPISDIVIQLLAS